MKEYKNIPKVNTICILCGKPFYAKPNWIKRGKGKYCSVDCVYKSQRKGKFVKCFVCGKSIWRQPRQLKLSISKNYFCSKKCMMSKINDRYGPAHPNWKKGKYVDRKLVLKDKKKSICCRCGKNDKRVLLIHHIDGNRINNDSSNLVWLCYNCHWLVHLYGENIS